MTPFSFLQNELERGIIRRLSGVGYHLGHRAVRFMDEHEDFL